MRADRRKHDSGPMPALDFRGADDGTIFADILSVAQPQARAVRLALRRLDEAGDGPFAMLDAGRQAARCRQGCRNSGRTSSCS